MEIIRQHFITLDSTNTWAKLHAEELTPHAITLVTADEQTGGRGRFNRHWVSPIGQNIYASYCFFLPKLRDDIGNIPQIMALSVFEVLDKLKFNSKLKWPNDVLIDGRKVAGILCETTMCQEALLVVVGVGLNVNMTADQVNKIDRPATSLMLSSGKAFEVSVVLDLLTKQFQKNLLKFLEHGFSPFFEKYVSKLMHQKGDSIKFNDNNRVWDGIFEGVDKDGSILIILENGIKKHFFVGEIPY